MESRVCAWEQGYLPYLPSECVWVPCQDAHPVSVALHYTHSLLFLNIPQLRRAEEKEGETLKRRAYVLKWMAVAVITWMAASLVPTAKYFPFPAQETDEM